jgi:site-specific DNA-methyltransferase (adenine-specific)
VNARILVGDCRAMMATLPDASVDAVVCDPPYELGFMGKAWDASGIAYDVEVWRQAFRVLKPGGHLLAFSGSRTYHRMTCAIEDAGFDIRDQIMWVYGSGFPKSLDVSKAIDKAAGAEREVVGRAVYGDGHVQRSNESIGYGGSDASADVRSVTSPATDAARQWSGWGTALKPAHEPICMARKPLIGTVAANVLAHGTGAINVDGCRVHRTEGDTSGWAKSGSKAGENRSMSGANYAREPKPDAASRWPANFIHDGSEEVVGLFPETRPGERPARQLSQPGGHGRTLGGGWKGNDTGERVVLDAGSAARFFYTAKASREDREDGCDDRDLVRRTDGRETENHTPRLRTTERRNPHPTVKPTDLMRYLCRLVTPPGGTVLDPFTGSGSTGRGAVLEGFDFIGCELSPEYAEIARARIRGVAMPLFPVEVA